ncbi:MAG: hypothetical protein V3V08_20795 [Nannocystaceae bacterium]
MASFEIARVGEVLVTPTFVVVPNEVVSYREMVWLGRLEDQEPRGAPVWGGPIDPRTGPCFPHMELAGRWRLCIATQKALAQLWKDSRMRGPGRQLRWRGAERVSRWPAIGEDLHAVASVLRRTQPTRRSQFLTLAVQIRGPAATLLASFEVGVDFCAPRCRAVSAWSPWEEAA